MTDQLLPRITYTENMWLGWRDKLDLSFIMFTSSSSDLCAVGHIIVIVIAWKQLHPFHFLFSCYWNLLLLSWVIFVPGTWINERKLFPSFYGVHLGSRCILWAFIGYYFSCTMS